MSEKIVDVTGTYYSSGIEGGYCGYTLEIDDQDISALVREKLGLEYQDVIPTTFPPTVGTIDSRWRLRVRIEVVEVGDES